MRKTSDLKAAENLRILEACQAGITTVFEDPVVCLADKLLDETAVELADVKHDDPLYYIRNQVVRSTGSVGANLVEGLGRGYRGDMRKSFLIARGSAYESAYWLRALSKQKLFKMCVEVCNLIDAKIIEITTAMLENTDEHAGPTEAEVDALAKKLNGLVLKPVLNK